MNLQQGGVVRSLQGNGAAGPSVTIVGKAIEKRIDWGATLITKKDAQRLLDFRNSIA